MRLSDPAGCNLDNCERASDHILHQKKCESDNRLFPDYPLYCEGLPRPVLRGVLHLVCLLLLPFGMLHLVMESDGSRLGSIAAIVYISTNIFCYGFSAMYHVGRWSAHNEILLQKIDHCGIAILTAGTFFPSSVLLLPIEVGFPFLITTLSACIWTCYHIWHLRPSSTRQIIVIATLLPFMPFLSPRMSTLEFWGTIFTMAFQAIGATIFLNKKPDPWPSSFGYHEIFHVFVVLAGICVYFTNWSIIRRTCNPYSTHSDITDLLLGTLWSPIIWTWPPSQALCVTDLNYIVPCCISDAVIFDIFISRLTLSTSWNTIRWISVW